MKTKSGERLTPRVMPVPGRPSVLRLGDRAYGAFHAYAVDGVDSYMNQDFHLIDNVPFGCRDKFTTVLFQCGPINERGRNGLTNEQLLEMVADRLGDFQKTEFACRENAIALTKIEEALMWLNQRTYARTMRGVEGTNAV